METLKMGEKLYLGDTLKNIETGNKFWFNSHQNFLFENEYNYINNHVVINRFVRTRMLLTEKIKQDNSDKKYYQLYYQL